MKDNFFEHVLGPHYLVRYEPTKDEDGYLPPTNFTSWVLDFDLERKGVHVSPMLVCNTKVYGIFANGHNLGTLAGELIDSEPSSTLAALQRFLGARVVDRVEGLLAGKEVTLWFDDEGLLSGGMDLSHFGAGSCSRPGFAVTFDNGDVYTLVGKVLITGHDGHGNLACSYLDKTDFRGIMGKQIIPAIIPLPS